MPAKPEIGSNCLYADVVEATLKYINEIGRAAAAWKIAQAVADDMGLRPLPGQVAQLSDKFYRQVSKALDELARNGRIIKYTRGSRLPWMGPHGRLSVPEFFSHAGLNKAAQEAKEKADVHAENVRRATRIRNLLGAYRITPKVSTTLGSDVLEVRLDLDQWEDLLKQIMTQ